MCDIEPKTAEVGASDSTSLLCGMERISHTGRCNRPAKYLWLHNDGKTTPVCDECVIGVWVCGCNLQEIPNNSVISGNVVGQ